MVAARAIRGNEELEALSEMTKASGRSGTMEESNNAQAYSLNLKASEDGSNYSWNRLDDICDLN